MFKSAPTLDIPYARKVLEHLIAHPEEHDQDFYGAKTACGTTACIAGTAVIMDAATTVVWDGAGLTSTVCGDGEYMDIEDRATDLLGLDPFEAARLFHNYDNAGALRQLAGHINEAEAAQAKELNTCSKVH